MQTAARTRTNWLDEQTLNAARPKVRELLQNSEGFRKLPLNEQKELANRMVKVAAYMANPDGLAAQELSPRGGLLASGQADAVEATKKRLSESPGFAGKDFQAGAVQQGVEQFGALVKKVDFPMFVSGLIQNVFQAIVDSSIQQMRAYGELLANVAKTVDQFAQDNITLNSSRDYLASKFPDSLEVSTGEMSGEFAEGDTPPEAQPKLVTKGDNAEEILKQISAELNLAKPITDISDETQELALVQGARLQIARQRQQLLASMVVLGINRIVVTDGLIHAKVVFDMRASDTAKRGSRAAMFDRSEQKYSAQAELGYSSWLSPWSGSLKTQASTDHMATVESSVDETSESKAQVKAQLTGEVRVNFKSDYFPMEKLANPQMMAAIQGNAKPVDTAPPPAAAAPPKA